VKLYCNDQTNSFQP